MDALCRRCKQPGEFYAGRRVCTVCVQAQNDAWVEANRERRNASNRAIYHRMPEEKKRIHKLTLRAKKLGLTAQELEAIEIRQDGKCAICGQRERPFHMHIDHCHKTGAVRAVLCRQCNYLIANARESVDILERAIEYLKEHQK